MKVQKPRTSRRHSREKAVVLLYQKDLLDKKIDYLIENHRLDQRPLDDFALKLIMGVDRNIKEIDAVICSIVENWSLERIAVIDRNILRVAIYEMLHEQDIPLKVSVDEAIEIAKSLGQKDDTPKFINGVLGKFLAGLAPDKGQQEH